jgi:anti-sigma factor RsiW
MSRWVPARRVDHVQHLLSDYIDGCLSARAARNVEVHLAVCPECARELKEWRALLHLVSCHASVPCPIDCADEVLQRLNADTHRGSTLCGRGNSLFLRASLPSLPALWAAVAIIVAVLFGGWTWRQGSRTPTTTTAAVQPPGITPPRSLTPVMHGEAPERLDGAFGRSDSLILASDFAAEE